MKVDTSIDEKEGRIRYEGKVYTIMTATNVPWATRRASHDLLVMDDGMPAVDVQSMVNHH